MLACIGVTIASLLGSSYLTQRAASGEAQSSLSGRFTALSAGLSLVESRPLTGYGPGIAREAAGTTTGRGVSLENSWLEWTVALGVPGLLLIGCLYADALRRSLRGRDAALVGALIAFLTAAAGFNWLEGHPTGHILFGLLLGWAFAGGHNKYDLP